MNILQPNSPESTLKVSLVSGLFGEYICADCYINDVYYDFYYKTTGYEIKDEYNEIITFYMDEYRFIESELRRQYEERQ